jgi:hypothetical protein
MEKYHINENRDSFIKKNLENHVSNWIEDTQVTIIDERGIRTIFHEIGKPLELLVGLGFLFECRKCKTVRVNEKVTCGSCGKPYTPKIFSVSILGSSQIQKLKQWTFSHPLAKFTVFLLVGVVLGIGSIKLPIGSFSFLVIAGIFVVLEYYDNIPFSRFYGILGYFTFYLIKGLFLIYIALITLINLLMYDFESNSVLFRNELIPAISILVTILLWVVYQPNNRLNYFKYVRLEKQLQFRFKLLWLSEIIAFVILVPIGFSLTFVEMASPELLRIHGYNKIIGIIILMIVPFFSGIVHLFVLKPFITRFREKNSLLESNQF